MAYEKGREYRELSLHKKKHTPAHHFGVSLLAFTARGYHELLGARQILTCLWNGIIHEDEDRLLRIELDPLTDHVNELTCRHR